MTKVIEPRTLAGFRDFLPEQMAVRNRAVEILREVFEKYGFVPLETPTLEFQDILLGKYGEEAEKLMYLFEDAGKRPVGMRYDLTVPVARVVAQYPSLPKPFKRYQLQPVWRADKPQKGRYREFMQCDIDTLGSTSPVADAEILSIISECLTKLGFNNFGIKINSRHILFGILRASGLKPDYYQTASQTIDKADKRSIEDLDNELESKGLGENLFSEVISQEIAKVSQKFGQTGKTGDDHLDEIINIARKMGANGIQFSPITVRGLDYYTGAIFETIVTEPKIGSLGGGGRYDKLIGTFIGEDLPAVGYSFGLDRIVDVITELNLWPDLPKTPTKVLVTVFSPELLKKSLDITTKIREGNTNAEIYLDPEARLDKQLKYADAKGIPYAVIIGPDEAEKNLVTLKDLRNKTQTTITPEEAVRKIREED